jgi:hypothetical protein
MNAINIRRRLLLSGAVGALALPSRTAQADTTFANFSFAATGAPAVRTMPDRLSDIINVKDWGALGKRSNDTTAIQNAINHAISKGGGKVFFPPGIYYVNNLTIGSNSDVGVQLIGSGKDASYLLSQSRSGYTLSRGGQPFDNIERIEGLQVIGPNAIQVTRTGVTIIDCRVGGFFGIDATQAVGAAIHDCYMNGGAGGKGADSTQPYNLRGTIGIAIGSGVVMNTRIMAGIDVSFALSGQCPGLYGCVTEVVNTGCRVGWGIVGGVAAEVPAYGAVVQNFQTERTNTPLDLYNCTGGFISGVHAIGGAGTPIESPISNITWSSGTATVTTANPHRLSPGAHKLQFIGMDQWDWAPNWPSAIGLFTATVPNSPNNQFTYPLTAPGTPFTKGFWNHPLEYSLRCRKVYETVIMGINPSVQSVIASVDLDYNGQAEARNNVFYGAQGEYGWLLPSNTKNLAGWHFINCGVSQLKNVAIGIPITLDGVTSPMTAAMHFSDLPGQSGVIQDGPFESQEYSIVDGQKSGGRAAGFDDTVTGGGTGHYKVRYNGTVWKRIG